MQTTPDQNLNWLRTIRTFLAELGIPVLEKPLSDNTFVPGVHVEKGQLYIDPEKLLYPGDVLHEAGHIALTEAHGREKFNGNLTESIPGTEGQELGVICWTWLAIKEMDIPPEVVFHAGGYKNDSEWLIEQFQNGYYMGLPLLEWMGITAPYSNDGGVPEVLKWLRD